MGSHSLFALFPPIVLAPKQPLRDQSRPRASVYLSQSWLNHQERTRKEEGDLEPIRAHRFPN